MTTLPTSLDKIRRAISNKHFQRSLPRSLAHLVFDLTILALNSWLIISLLDINLFLAIPFSIFQGSIFWSLFVIGHDCGHQSFSKYGAVNNIIGFVLHQSLLVPYWGWKRSHHKHHCFHGNLDKDESHVPLSKSEAIKSGLLARSLILFLYLSGIVYATYLHLGNLAKNKKIVSHFYYNTSFFYPSDKKWIYLGTLTYILTILALLVCLFINPILTIYLYLLPLLVSYHLLVMITFLQHHFKESVWYYNEDWDFVKGARNTADYRYKHLNSVISFLHHRIATHHLIHHLFSGIPHYNLKPATKELFEKFAFKRHIKQFSYSSYVKLVWESSNVHDRSPECKQYHLLDKDQRPLKDR